jgi:L-asparaginase II
VLRNGLPESWHFGAAAVATPEGRLVARLGDPEGAATATFLRSAAKPFQALPLLLAGGAERFGLDDADVALLCASHSGGPEHAARAAALLAKGGFTAADLLCGVHTPLGREEARRLREEGTAPTPLHNNCSGKHAGMLLACRLLGFPKEDYVDTSHPLQRLILGHVARLTGVPPEEIGVGVDGCGVPCFRLPVAAAARGYAALADPAAAGLPADLAAAVRRAIGAMAAAPEMVAGRGRFTTRLIATAGGRVVGKEGAEGFYAVAVRGPVALGIALKVADGGERCRDGAVLDLLRQVGSLSGEELAALDDLYRPVVRNCREIAVGEVRPEVELEEVEVECPR